VPRPASIPSWRAGHRGRQIGIESACLGVSGSFCSSPYYLLQYVLPAVWCVYMCVHTFFVFPIRIGTPIQDINFISPSPPQYVLVLLCSLSVSFLWHYCFLFLMFEGPVSAFGVGC
jgi:hypothetical protein